MIIGGKTDVGKKRSNNQDTLKTALKNGVALAVVCDGMGGANGGSVASDIAARTVLDTFDELIEQSSDYTTILLTAVARANDRVYTRSREDESLSGMGTTIVACIIDDRKIYAVNVGDSRLYMINNYNLRQVTKDHSYVQTLLDKGKITKEQSINHPSRNIITRAIGIDSEVDIDLYELPHEHKSLLLCSDGLYNYASEKRIVGIIENDRNLDVILDDLIDEANEGGGDDNISVIVVKV